MSKKTEDRKSKIEDLKQALASCAHTLNISDASVRVLMGFIDLAEVPDHAVLPRWVGDPSQWSKMELQASVNQHSIALLIHKDVRSIRKAIQALEKFGYIVRMPHKAGERLVTKINGSKIYSDAADAWQVFNWSR